MSEDIYPEPDQQRSRLLWNILAQIPHGKAYTILRSVPRGYGLTVWSRLFTEYETPDQLAKHMAVLSGLLRPLWRDEPTHFMETLLDWECQCSELHVVSGVKVSDQIKCAIVCAEAPRAIRHYLQMQPQDVVQNFTALKKAVQLFLLRGRNYDQLGAQRQQLADDPMEVDELAQEVVPSSLKGVGKGKGKWRPGRQERAQQSQTSQPDAAQPQRQQQQPKGKGKGGKGLGRGGGSSYVSSEASASIQTPFAGSCY